MLDLSSDSAGLVSERVDIVIRMGAFDSKIVARRLGLLHRYGCASPGYLARRGTPIEIEDLRDHDVVDLPLRDGRRYVWSFEKDGAHVEHQQAERLTVNCALTLHKMLLEGLGLSSGKPVGRKASRPLVSRMEPVPSVPVRAAFPSRRELALKVRAFVAFMMQKSRHGHLWQDDPLNEGRSAAL